MFGLLYKNDLFQDGCFHYSVTFDELNVENKGFKWFKTEKKQQEIN